jgi:hypothetical protein
MYVKKQTIKANKESIKYIVDRSFQDIFCNTLTVLGFTIYASPDDGNSIVINKKVNGYICGDYIIRPYSDYSDLPNFEHVPSGFKMSWYKYPLRSAEANQDLSFVEFMRVLGWER